MLKAYERGVTDRTRQCAPLVRICAGVEVHVVKNPAPHEPYTVLHYLQ